MYKNRFGVATNPGESIKLFAEFLKNEVAIKTLGDFNKHPEI